MTPTPAALPGLSRRDFVKLGMTLPAVPMAGRLAEMEGLSGLQTRPPNILVLLFDTLSARHISLYGYQRETMPNLARFAERAMVYHSHYAAGNFTTPGTTSLLTGAYPWSHRGMHIWGTAAEEFASRSIFGSLDPSKYTRISYTHNPLVSFLLHQFRADIDALVLSRELTLVSQQFSDLLFKSDYSMAYMAEGRLFRPPFWQFQSSSLFLALVDKFRRLVERSRYNGQYSDLFPRGLPNHHDVELFLVEDAVDWMLSLFREPLQPFFAYVHLWPPHHPYNARDDFIGKFQDSWTPEAKPSHFFTMKYHPSRLNKLRMEYDEYIGYVDAEFGRLVDSLERSGDLDNTYLIFTSDHGELFERGIFQHLTPTLYEPLVHIPLLISRPGQKAREDIRTPTNCIDLFPTLMKITGGEVPEWCEGEVLPGFSDAPASSDRSIYMLEAKSNSKHRALSKATLAVRRGRHKLVHYIGYGGHEDVYEMYDLENDPEEVEELSSSNSSVAAELKSDLAQKIREVNAPYI